MLCHCALVVSDNSDLGMTILTAIYKGIYQYASSYGS